MAINVQRASKSEVGQISEIWQASGLSPWPQIDIEMETGRPQSIFLAAHWSGGEDVLGFILGRRVPSADDENREDAEMYNIGVRHEWRRIRVGSALINSFIDHCRQAGVLRIWLEVRVSNITAIKFYRRHGFTAAGTRKSFYRDPVEDALVMSFSIQPLKQYSFEES